MDSIGSRIRFIIKSNKITNAQFAEKLKVDPSFISQLTSNKRNASDRTISDICREFGVNETWLRTGDGQPFRQLSRTEELSAFFGDVLSDAPNFRSALITVLSRMSPDEWQLLERKAWELAQEMEKTGPD